MTVLDSSTRAIASGDDLGELPIDEAHLAAAAFLARYRGRTLEAYRYDLRVFFQWASDHGLDVLAATRPEIELYVRTMEERGLAPSTIDRRLSTVCGLYRFAHIDGRISSNPAQHVHRPKVHESQDRSELGTFLFTAERYDHTHAALAVLLGLNGLRSARRAPRTSKTFPSSARTECCASSARAARTSTSTPPTSSSPSSPEVRSHPRS